MNVRSTGDATVSPNVAPSDRAARVFVGAVWLAMLSALVGCFIVYAHDLPLAEDWLVAVALTGQVKSIGAWLWALNNEHRNPVGRLVLLALGGDFRAGMIANIVVVAALTYAMMRTARRLRGRASYADAFFPLTLMHLGHWGNLLWSWQFTQVSSVVVMGVMLLMLVEWDTLETPGRAAAASACLVLLPLSGAIGLLFEAPVALWLGYLGAQYWRAGRRTAGVLLLASVVATAAITVVYFVGYKRPAWAPESAGLLPSLHAAMQFLALGLGPIARETWTLAIAATLAILVSSLAVAAVVASARDGAGPARARALIFYAAGMVLLAAAIGWGRSGAIGANPEYAEWPLRYALMAAPAFCAAYFAWELYGSDRARTVAQASMCLVFALALPWNTKAGFGWGLWYHEGAKAVERDIDAGMPIDLLAARHKDYLVHSWRDDEIASYIRLMRNAGISAFARIRADEPEQLVAQNIRYRVPNASSVYLEWGVDGWKPASHVGRPKGSTFRHNVVRTPMQRGDGDWFTTRVRVPVGSRIDYGFVVNEERDGSLEYFWDGSYTSAISPTALTHEHATKPADVAWSPPSATENGALVVREIRYRLPGAGEVRLWWGVNDWQAVPETIRPPETVIEKRLMTTPMSRDGDVFIARVAVPAGAILDYGFQIVRNRQGDRIHPVWEMAPDSGAPVAESATVEWAGKMKFGKPQGTRG